MVILLAKVAGKHKVTQALLLVLPGKRHSNQLEHYGLFPYTAT